MKSIKSVHPLQTKPWADFRKNWGNEVIKTSYGYITLHKVPLLNKKIGMFIRGPKPTKSMLSDLQKFGAKNNLIFIKLEPFHAVNSYRHSDFHQKGYSLDSESIPDRVRNDDSTIELLKNNNCVPGKTFFTPTSFWIDLTRSEEELMSSFHKKTRYNIRLAQRKGVEVKIDNSDKAFNKYIDLMRETVERQRFYARNENYHRLMWKTLHTDMIKQNKKPIANLLVAKYKKEILSTWILFNYDKFLYYPYGASTHKHKNLMASNLMMWEAIRFGKKMKLKTFDLWGREEGKGFTRFKEGYNPKVIKYIGTWDLIINKPVYNTYVLMEKTRWLSLRFKSHFQKPKF